MAEVKFCADCKHIKRAFFEPYDTASCKMYKTHLNIVSGVQSYGYCSGARKDASHCGPSGKFFESRGT